MATNDKRPGPTACRRRMPLAPARGREQARGSGGVPREHVLVDLGMVEETVLNPNLVPGQLALEYRNSLELTLN
jgi:hypothetical protein